MRRLPIAGMYPDISWERGEVKYFLIQKIKIKNNKYRYIKNIKNKILDGIL